MQLTYRGVPYEYNPPHIDISDSETVGTYRGCPIHFHRSIRLPNFKRTIELIYRGSHFRTGLPTA